MFCENADGIVKEKSQKESSQGHSDAFAVNVCYMLKGK